jgi:hypothetical protein
MAYTINRRLSTLVDSNGQLNTGKIPNDYIDGNHIADNTITTAMLHTSFTVSSSNLSSIDTDAVSEGSTNLYHTSERVDDRVASLLTAGTGITLTYDDAANTLTIAGAAQYGDSDVESYLSGGTGVTFSSGVISIGQAVGTSDNVQFNNVQVDGTLTSDDITSTNISIAGNATITGNLTVSGTTTTVNSNTVNIGDNILVLNSDETGTPSQDAGFEIERGTSTNKTLIWNETSDKWTVGSETFVAGTFEGALTGDVTGTVSDISNHDTDSLSEGSTNLYYTDARVESYLDGGTSTPTFASGIISGDLTVDTSTLKVDSTNNRVGIGNATPDVSLDVGSATDALFVPKGTTAQRPTGVDGYFRYNTDDAQFEGYADGAWGAIAGSGSGGSAMETDTFTGDGSTTAFTLSTAASSEDNLIVFIEGVYQNKDDYVVSGTTLTFDVAPVNTRKIVVHHVKDSISGNNMILNQFSGDGSTTAFTLTVSLTSENNSQVYIDGVYQQKDSYTVGGTTLTFDTAPVNGTTIEVMIFTQTTINVPTANSIGISELNVSDGTSGQVLTTNGSGTLSFSTISGYTDSDVETYLNTSTIYTDPTNNRVGIGDVPSSNATGSMSPRLFVDNNLGDGTLGLQIASYHPSIVLSDKSSGLHNYIISHDGGHFSIGYEGGTAGSSNSFTSRLKILSSGNVGIGETSPLDKLHLTTTSGDTAIRLENSAGNNARLFLDTSNDINLEFNATPRLVIDSNGLSSFKRRIEISGDSTQNRFILRSTSGSPAYQWCLDNSADQLRIFREDDGTGSSGSVTALFDQSGHLAFGSNVGAGVNSNAGLDISNFTNALKLPTGTTAQRPTGENGMIRHNTTDSAIEAYVGGSWKALGTVFSASGGTMTTSGGYVYHVFTTSGTFSVTAGTKTVDYLIVAGGGGGGSRHGGGGGAGGYRTGSAAATIGNYTVTVGAGGAGGVYNGSVAGTGGTSTVFSTTSIGGGIGGNYPSQNPTNGGSGGGAGNRGAGTFTGGSGTAGQGNDGGDVTSGGADWAGAGGGGAGAAGGGATGGSGVSGGNGGVGSNSVSSWATATSTGDSGYFAGGGGGGGSHTNGTGGSGGTGGGGDGTALLDGAGNAATANTGGGGGGARDANGGAGGSGIVIIRYTV